ncbi:MAG: hypothetical protein MRQ09_04975 [Candidatus Midichloria sp.]|nr:hypothetical protein [Candidatus Midichloria sp.]
MDIAARESYVRKEASAEARAQGMVEGKLEGERDKTIEIAKKMLAAGQDAQFISVITGLSIEDIQKLRSEI